MANNNKYIFSIAKNALTHHENWQNMEKSRAKKKL